MFLSLLSAIEITIYYVYRINYSVIIGLPKIGITLIKYIVLPKVSPITTIIDHLQQLHDCFYKVKVVLNL